jgi:hypothetical protein
MLTIEKLGINWNRSNIVVLADQEVMRVIMPRL